MPQKYNPHAAFAASLRTASVRTLDATHEDLLRRLSDAYGSPSDSYIGHIKERLALVERELSARK